MHEILKFITSTSLALMDSLMNWMKLCPGEETFLLLPIVWQAWLNLLERLCCVTFAHQTYFKP